ncbi:hypothetical protein [Sorangium sp. So ce128]|uniref:hypothetical protein n=1 Tax=Sorangium sp. So ce128 TaxID=3133281 RepID=UPI003F62512E
MASVAVKVETKCGACGARVPVNRLAREVGCPRCGRSTAIDGGLWSGLLRDAIHDGPKLALNEERRSSAGDLSVVYARAVPACHGCETAIPVASVQEVRAQALIRCARCARRIWVRAVPAEVAGALPSVTHLVGEEPDRRALPPELQVDAATLPCPRCGATVELDGVNRTCACKLCGASVSVPGERVGSGASQAATPWVLCFDPSVSERAPAVAAGLFDWKGLPEVAVDREGNLYCAATQSRWHCDASGCVNEEVEHVLWSIDPSLNVRWVRRDLPGAARSLHCSKDRLLVIGARRSPPLWLSLTTGAPVEDPAAAALVPDADRRARGLLTCDRDGSLLICADGKLRRIAANGVEVPVWASSARQSDASIYDLKDLRDRPVHLGGTAHTLHCGPDGSLYMVDESPGGALARFDADGRKVYCVELPRPEMDHEELALGADLRGNAYVLGCSRVVRVSATGEPSIVVKAEIDFEAEDGPSFWSERRLAVCPDGAFWLFSEEGIAWKFDPAGRLLFDGEKEPGPRKMTRDQALQRAADMAEERLNLEMKLEMEQARARAEEEQARVAYQSVIQEKVAVERFKRERNRILLRHGCIHFGLVVILGSAIFLWAMWKASQPLSP